MNQQVKPGSVILLHPIYGQPGNELKTIEGILSFLSKKEYQFVTDNGDAKEVIPIVGKLS
ncbi:hypothetical protein WD019_16280 [Fictibacillus sp. Mic-4]|uniref:hypothetical protein n=1 Tax=Fictibacillus sp. Mic-4 TaxID=3132826 RepID=UPI003CF32C55